MIKLLLLVVPYLAFAGYGSSSSSSEYKYKEEIELAPSVQAPKSSKSHKKSGKTKVSGLMSDLLSSEKNIEALLLSQEKNLIVRKSDDSVRALTRVKGVVLNSILAMNIKPTTFIVKIADSASDLDGAELRCLGMSFEKRVPAQCDLLVTNDGEFKTDVKVWDLDGADGIIADYYS
ncbi:MAG: hypothetical protein A2485_13500 [Bdellovibrionales bacterium RIFOXYC12_FULL_39_17]|nr:MAG: hypothetical protein A2485_13500 [Bdellovibrionales bacterium RIFOXYC12_FULL_39_17]